MGVIRTRLILSVMLLVLVAGCKTTYVMDVDALSTPGAEICKTYFLVPGNKNVPPDDLEFLEICRYVRRGLDALGFVASPQEQADVVVAISYGISKPQQRFNTYSYPTYGYQSGGKCGKPVYGMTGYNTQVYTYDVYTHTLKLIARETHPVVENGECKEIWRVVVTSTNTSNDLRSFIPYLVAAAQPFIAEQTEETVEVKLKENADAAMIIRFGRETWEQMKEEEDD